VFSEELVTFLEELRANNNKPWFDAHRTRYDALRGQFLDLTTEIIAASSRFDADLADLQASSCMFRINRDIRFSKEKTPYKTTFSAVLSPGKKDSMQGYYYCIDANGSLEVGAGIHQPDTARLQKLRKAIVREGEKLDGVLKEPKLKKSFGTLDGEQLKTAPRDYPPDHPYIHYLRHKGFTVGCSESVVDIPEDALATHVADLFATASPLVKLIREWCS